MNEKVMKEAMRIIVNNPRIIGEVLKNLQMPNIKTPTLGGEVFWNNLFEYKDWKLQQNIFTGHCRILDENNIRHAWGGENAIKEVFQKIIEYAEKYQNLLPKD